jgi:dihydroorotate dehydrogenase
MFYSLIKPFLFRMDAEKAHHFTLRTLKIAHSLRLTNIIKKKYLPCEMMGLHLDNPIGLAAGLDKNGDYINALAALGFGFIEIGTVTPKPQTGNPLPRLFRLPEYNALLNRMGFNNKGLDYVVERLKNSTYKGVMGVNIGKNRDTPLEQAEDDYVLGFQRVAPFASYVTINISSPNTENLRKLQQGDLLKILLQHLKHEQKKFFDASKKYVPLVVKIAPDLTHDDIKQMAEIFLAEKIDGVIATNTTLSRNGINHFSEAGGLSGAPLAKQSTDVIKKLYEVLQEQIPIIGCGGIFSEKDIEEKWKAGAKFFQVYTGLIYEGPGVIAGLVESAKNIIASRNVS